MSRFFVEQIADTLKIVGENHQHIAYSLRMRVGDEVVLFCGDGFDYNYRIEAIKKNETTLTLISKRQNDCESGVSVDAFVSLIKHDKLSLIFQKLTELGVRQFFPTVTEFSQTKGSDFNLDRYQKICVEACKQCGRSVVPNVNAPLKFSDLIEVFGGYDLVVFAYEKAVAKLKALLERNKNVQKVAVLIGAEGGFSEREVVQLTSAGYQPISLGGRILRAETAAIAAVSAVLYELDW